METKQIFEEKLRLFNWQLTFKVIAIGFITLALLIPQFMIQDLVRERENTAGEAKKEVTDKWSLNQTLRGPVLTIPFTEQIYDNEGKMVQEKINEYHCLPETLNINGEISSKDLHRSIYQSVVYESAINLSGNFRMPDFEKLRINPADNIWEKARISVAISDLRGITSLVDLNWNGQVIPFSPGMDNPLIGNNGISIAFSSLSMSDFPARFEIKLNLKGSDELQFAPLGETTDVSIRSTWNDPGFTGNFLPAERNVSESGFDAHWKVLNFNRNFPQEWVNDVYKPTIADFGVRLVLMADHYQKSMRSVKYGVLVILFMFLSFFLNEILTKQKIHSFQYILVGFAILIFYLLLLSISEHLGFNIAYLISSVSVLVMVFSYSRSFLKTVKSSLLLSAILAFSLGFIFVLMQLESFALLVGSIGLFCVLALTMYFTRKINWYND